MRLASVGMLLLLLACATAKSSFSTRDVKTFHVPPAAVIDKGEYFLRWTYGAYGYAFRPQYELQSVGLVFWLPMMSDESVDPGSKGEISIFETDAIKAIEAGNVWWQESDGELTKLEVQRPYEVPDQ